MGVGASVALAVAFGVIMVRTCRRRRLIKVRFGGKVSIIFKLKVPVLLGKA